MNFLTSLLQAIGGIFGFVKSRSDANNTADQRSNAEAKQIQADKERARAEINNPDQTKLNEDVAP